MTVLEIALVAAGATLGLWLAFVLALLALGRREDARDVVRFVPDCAVLFGRLLRDPAISRPRKLMIAALVAYLASPLDLIPDFIPVAGQLDDAILVVLALRTLLRGSEERVAVHWPGSSSSLAVLMRLAGERRRAAS